MTSSYLIDGKAAQGEDLVRAIDALPKDDLNFVSIKIPNRGEVSVLRTSEGFLVYDERLDGSTWSHASGRSSEGLSESIRRGPTILARWC